MSDDAGVRPFRISGIHIRTFGGINDLGVHFEPGLNVVLGDNESGKSTLFRAIQHTMLTPTNLDKRALQREMDPHMPRPDGNFAECDVVLEGEGSLRIRRRWGADAEEEATLPDGTTVRGPDAVRKAVDRFLPVSPVTFRTILLADQSQLDRTAELLKQNPGARDEAAAALRSARLAAGGVSPDLFMRNLHDRLDRLLGRWDSDAELPEGGRRYTDPWSRGAGRIVQAYYVLEELKANLENALRAEAELERAREELEETGDRFRAADAFVLEHADANAALIASRGLAGEIAAAQEQLNRLRTDNRRWPILQRDLADLQVELSELNGRKAGLDKEIGVVRAREKQLLDRQKLDRADHLLADLEAAREDRDRIPVVDEKVLSQLREVESRLPYAEASLSSGHLRATVSATETQSITVSADGGPASESEAAPKQPVEVRAARQLLINAGSLTFRIESGEESFEDLSSQLEALREEKTRFCAALQATSAAEAEGRLHRRAAADARVSQLEQSVSRELDVADIAAAVAARNELAGQADLDSGTEAGPSDTAGRSQQVITDELAAVSRQLGAADGRTSSIRNEIRTLESEYGTQEDLENLLGETNRVLSGLAARRDERAGVPEGFQSPEEFLGVYEERQRVREAALQTYNECRIVYAELIGSQPERNSDEFREEIRDAAAELDGLKREAKSLGQVQEAATKVLGDLDATVFDPFVAMVADYAGQLTGGAYAPGVGEDPLEPEQYERAAGGGNASADGYTVSLPYALLSQGTRDSLALAVRLALAETVLGQDSAPFILDDPLVDMDPSRRAAAAGAIARFAGRHQVIVLTCHPEHADLFGDAHRVTL